MTIADDFSLRNPTLYSASRVADAVDALISRRWGGTSTGAANVYAITLTPTPTGYENGQPFLWIPNHTNTGAATLNVNSQGALALRYMGQVLVGGELVSGVPCYCFHNGTNITVLNHGGGWATWTPTYTCSGSMTYTAVTTNAAIYQRHGNTIRLKVVATGTIGGTVSNGVRFSLPVTQGVFESTPYAGYVTDAATASALAYQFSTSVVEVMRYDAVNWTAGTNRVIAAWGEYRV